MNKTALYVALIIAGAFLLGILLGMMYYTEHTRYDLQPTGSSDRAFVIDRQTGEVWFYYLGGKGEEAVRWRLKVVKSSDERL